MVICRKLLRSSALARFFLLGMVISALPQCATFTHDRLLLPVGIGGLGLVALFIAGVHDGEQKLGSSRWVRLLAGFWILAHLVLAPLSLPGKTWFAGLVGRAFENGARSLNRAGPISGKTVVFVTGPDFFFTSWAPLIRLQLGLPTVERVAILGTGWTRIEVRRTDARTLVLRADGAFTSGPLDTLMRDPAHPFRGGERRRSGPVQIEVLRASPKGLPTKLRCRFPEDLDQLARRGDHVFVAWHPDGYHPFVPPRVGQAVTLKGINQWDLITLALMPPERFGPAPQGPAR